MGDPATRRATYEDLLAVPENLVAEILDGVLHTEPRPAFRHRRGVGGPGGWIVLLEVELHLHGDVLVPDLAGWRRERLQEDPGASSSVAPDWICEMLSPSTTKKDHATKMPIYAREGVAYAWLIDPVAQTLEAYRLERKKWLLLGTWAENAKARIQPFDAIELDLSLLWAW